MNSAVTVGVVRRCCREGTALYQGPAFSVVRTVLVASWCCQGIVVGLFLFVVALLLRVLGRLIVSPCVLHMLYGVT